MEKHNYHKDLVERLKDSEYAVDYLKETLAISIEEKDDEEFRLKAFRLALRNIAEAHEIIPLREG